MEVSSQLHAPATLPPGERALWYQPQSRSRRYGEEKNLAPARNCTLAEPPIAQYYTE
jgi:hypothetical protein